MTDDLTPAELAQATGKARAASQAAVLAKRGVPFVFVGHAVRVARAVAQAHALLPERRPERVPRLEPARQRKPAGLLAWEEERRAFGDEAEAAHAAFQAQWEAGEPQRRLEAKALKRATKALRRAAERQQCPAWADLDAIRAVYAEAARLTHATGVLHHVDHDIPLRGKSVSGLHVHQNLRAVPAKDNMRKGNRFTPC